MVLSIFVAMTVLWYCPGLIPPLTHSCGVGGPKMDLKKFGRLRLQFGFFSESSFSDGTAHNGTRPPHSGAPVRTTAHSGCSTGSSGSTGSTVAQEQCPSESSAQPPAHRHKRRTQSSWSGLPARAAAQRTSPAQHTISSKH